MSGYKMFADRLDYAFKEARTKWAEAYNLMKNAEKAWQRCSEDDKLSEEYYMNKARAAFDLIDNSVWADFEREMEEIGKALKSAFAKVNQARPEDIDRAGLELLNSGILTVDDLGALLDRYEDNPTMRRLIAQHVEKLLKDTKDTQTRRELIAVRQKAVANDIMDAWKNLEDTARICTGQAHGKGEPRYVLSISSQWEKLTENTIKNF